MKFGEKLIKLRKKEGLSQEQLGEQLDVTRQTISNWELGETSPTADQLKQISRLFNVSIDELLDNDINNIIIDKVSNTEKTTKLILKIILCIAGLLVVGFMVLVILRIATKSKYEHGNMREETIICQLYGEEHSYTINYYEETGIPKELGGDSYFSNILDLDKYEYADQIFDVINDYVKKNGGTCVKVDSFDLSNLISMYIKEDTLTKKGATIVIEEDEDMKYTYGEAFWLEKYDSRTNNYEVMKNSTGNNCGFNMMAYEVTKDKPLELKQDWSCEYGELEIGEYKIVKKVSIPHEPHDSYYIWTEFEIVD